MSVDLKIYQGSKGEWIGSFHRQDMANLVPRLPHPQFGFQRQDLPNLPPATTESRLMPYPLAWRLSAHFVFGPPRSPHDLPALISKGRSRLRLHRPLPYRPPVVDCL